MSNRPLIETNPHLKSPEKYRKALIINIANSTAVETGAPVASIIRTLSGKEKGKQIKKPRGSLR